MAFSCWLKAQNVSFDKFLINHSALLETLTSHCILRMKITTTILDYHFVLVMLNLWTAFQPNVRLLQHFGSLFWIFR